MSAERKNVSPSTRRGSRSRDSRQSRFRSSIPQRVTSFSSADPRRLFWAAPRREAASFPQVRHRATYFASLRTKFRDSVYLGRPCDKVNLLNPQRAWRIECLTGGRTQLIRKSGPYVSVAMMTLCATLAAQPKPLAQSGSGTASGKPAWLWTTEERITKRVNPAEREARRARGLQTARRVAPGWTPIDGSVEPELFLPVELVTRLVLNTEPPNDRMREVYRTAIAGQGWKYDQFWAVLHAAGAPYLSLMQESGVLQRQTRGRADLSQLQLQTCAASVDLLGTAYKTFGQQEFDEFLYRNVAPPIRTSIADHADTADALRKKDRGCR